MTMDYLAHVIGLKQALLFKMADRIPSKAIKKWESEGQFEVLHIDVKYEKKNFVMGISMRGFELSHRSLRECSNDDHVWLRASLYVHCIIWLRW